MIEEWRIRGELLQELDALRSRVTELEAQAARKKAEEQSKERRLSSRRFFDDADEGMLLVDAENRQFVIGNKAMCQMLGCESDEIENLGVVDQAGRRCS